MKSSLWWVAGALTLLASGVHAESVDLERDMAPDARLTVENTSGEVIVRGWSESRLSVQGDVDDRAELELREVGDGFLIKVRSRARRGHSAEADLQIRLPRGAALAVETVSADVDVSDMDNDSLRLLSVSGNVNTDVTTAHADIQTVSGDVELRGQMERLKLQTVSGDVRAARVARELDATTVSGDFTLRGGELRNVQMESVSGELMLESGLASGGRLVAQSMSGNVVLKMPDDLSARIQAASFSGDIASEFGDSRSDDRRDRRGARQRLDVSLGGGDAEINVETFSGDVRIVRP